jgi:pimeloyl-ACP methyl ester carboxylesterase
MDAPACGHPPDFHENACTFLQGAADTQRFTMDLSRLRDFAGPIQLTMGEGRPEMYPAVVHRIAASVPSAQVRSFAGADHFPHQTHAHEYAANILQLLAGAS